MQPSYRVSIIYQAKSDEQAKLAAQRLRECLKGCAECKEISTVVLRDNEYLDADCMELNV